MPRTRNIARTEENEPSGSRSTRSRNRSENVHPDSEKENHASKSTRSSRLHRPAGGVLGSTTTLIQRTTISRKGTNTTATIDIKKKTKTITKKEKVPLQDITSQFLPAPEAANRGEGFEDFDDEDEQSAQINIAQLSIPVRESIAHSPLPPSSPPAYLISQDAPSKDSIVKALFSDSSPSRAAQAAIRDPWEDDAPEPAADHALSADSSYSDPFGFAALERKLKVEREAAAAVREDSPVDDDLGYSVDDIPIADTDSPRPVRRLKRSLREDEDEDEDERNDEDEDTTELPGHLATPPTPHKDKKKRARLSHEHHNIFSPCSSSIESSPSPTKASARKSAQTPRALPDPLDDFIAQADDDDETNLPTSVPRPRKVRVQEDQPVVTPFTRRLRPRARSVGPSAEVNREPKSIRRVKAATGPRKATTSRKPHSEVQASPMKKGKETADIDLVEKWEQERRDRIEYFKKLEDYQVEKEDVYLI